MLNTGVILRYCIVSRQGLEVGKSQVHRQFGRIAFSSSEPRRQARWKHGGVRMPWPCPRTAMASFAVFAFAALGSGERFHGTSEPIGPHLRQRMTGASWHRG